MSVNTSNSVVHCGIFCVQMPHLMANIKDDLVLRCVENVVEGHCQLYYTQTRTQMPSCLRNSVDNVGPEFVAQLLQLLKVEVLHKYPATDKTRSKGAMFASRAFSKKYSGIVWIVKT